MFIIIEVESCWYTVSPAILLSFSMKVVFECDVREPQPADRFIFEQQGWDQGYHRQQAPCNYSIQCEIMEQPTIKLV